MNKKNLLFQAEEEKKATKQYKLVYEHQEQDINTQQNKVWPVGYLGWMSQELSQD